MKEFEALDSQVESLEIWPLFAPIISYFMKFCRAGKLISSASLRFMKKRKSIKPGGSEQSSLVSS
jgi:hypothetical protein